MDKRHFLHALLGSLLISLMVFLEISIVSPIAAKLSFLFFLMLFGYWLHQFDAIAKIWKCTFIILSVLFFLLPFIVFSTGVYQTTHQQESFAALGHMIATGATTLIFGFIGVLFGVICLLLSFLCSKRAQKTFTAKRP